MLLIIFALVPILTRRPHEVKRAIAGYQAAHDGAGPAGHARVAQFSSSSLSVRNSRIASKVSIMLSAVPGMWPSMGR